MQLLSLAIVLSLPGNTMPAYHLLDDLQLISLLKNDDRLAFAEIYTRYAEQLTKFTAAKISDLDEAGDIIHDLFVKFWEQRHTHLIEKNVKAYLFAMARYRVVDKIRKNITHQAYAEEIQNLEIRYAAFTDETLAVKEMLQRIAHSVDRLSPGVRQVYVLSREENLSIPEIAQKLQVSQQTVKNQLTTALKLLRRVVLVGGWWLLVVSLGTERHCPKGTPSERGTKQSQKSENGRMWP